MLPQKFTLIHLVTFSLTFTYPNEVLLLLYFNSSIDEMFMIELIVKYKIDTCK